METAETSNQPHQKERPEFSRKDASIRLLEAILFAAVGIVVFGILTAVVGFQLIYALVTRKHAGEHVSEFGAKVADYLYHIANYVTFNTNTQPFPFVDFPEEWFPERTNPETGPKPTGY